ncbi:MAG: NAD(+)/NADH kinase [Clostridia bacterium]|nr:NAD(+)/NADH kinase [Clostridia bacterium]MBR5767302.1 NAD(+)/NADH kinase [Clostridia bacterium]
MTSERTGERTAEIVTAAGRDPGLEYTLRTAALFREHGYKVHIPYVKTELPEWVSAEPCRRPEVEVVLGGDGSIMRASHFASRAGCPILGINTGHIGFLSEISVDETDRIADYFDGNYSIEERRMLQVYQFRNGNLVGRPSSALNDAVITHGRTAKILDLEVSCSGVTLGKFRADGYIVSTPTGSTAYSLSAGGPVVDPELRGICLTAICPHSLGARPVVVPDNREIEVKYLGHGGIVSLSVDGSDTAQLEPGDSVRISLSSDVTKFIRLGNKDKKSFYTRLRDKMSGA